MHPSRSSTTCSMACAPPCLERNSTICHTVAQTAACTVVAQPAWASFLPQALGSRSAPQ